MMLRRKRRWSDLYKYEDPRQTGNERGSHESGYEAGESSDAPEADILRECAEELVHRLEPTTRDPGRLPDEESSTLSSLSSFSSQSEFSTPSTFGQPFPDETDDFFSQQIRLEVDEMRFGTKLVEIIPPVHVTPEICYVRVQFAQGTGYVTIPIHMKHVFRVFCSKSTSRRTNQPNGVVFVFYVTPGMGFWFRFHFEPLLVQEGENQEDPMCWFDSESSIEERRRIVFLSRLESDNAKLCSLLQSYEVLTVLSEDCMNQVLDDNMTEELRELCTLQIPDANYKRHLVDEMLEKRKAKWAKAGILFIYPPPPAPEGITIRNEDFESLKPRTFISPSVVDFSLRYSFDEELGDERRSKFHFMHSSFYMLYSEKAMRTLTPDERHYRVRTHTRNLNIFEKEYTVFPIYNNCHWVLAVVCYPAITDVNSDGDDLEDGLELVKPCVLYFDSRGHETRIPIDEVHEHLTEFLTLEWNRLLPAFPRSFDRLPAVKVACTQLKHHITESGIYLLKMVDKFVEEPIIPPYKEQGIWLVHNDKHLDKQKRESIRRKIVQLWEEENERRDEKTT